MSSTRYARNPGRGCRRRGRPRIPPWREDAPWLHSASKTRVNALKAGYDLSSHDVKQPTLTPPGHLSFRAPGVPFPFFLLPRKRGKWSAGRRRALCESALADHNAARRAPLRRRAPPSDVGGRRLPALHRGARVRTPLLAPTSRSSLEDALDEQGCDLIARFAIVVNR